MLAVSSSLAAIFILISPVLIARLSNCRVMLGLDLLRAVMHRFLGWLFLCIPWWGPMPPWQSPPSVKSSGSIDSAWWFSCLDVEAETLLGAFLGAAWYYFGYLDFSFPFFRSFSASSPSSPCLSVLLWGCAAFIRYPDKDVWGWVQRHKHVLLLYVNFSLHSTAQHSVNSLGLSQGCCGDFCPCAFIEVCKKTPLKKQKLQGEQFASPYLIFVFLRTTWHFLWNYKVALFASLSLKLHIKFVCVWSLNIQQIQCLKIKFMPLVYAIYNPFFLEAV